MFNLVVEMSCKPVHKQTWDDVAGAVQLEGKPVFVPSVTANFVRKVAHLSAPNKPVALYYPAKVQKLGKQTNKE